MVVSTSGSNEWVTFSDDGDVASGFEAIIPGPVRRVGSTSGSNRSGSSTSKKKTGSSKSKNHKKGSRTTSNTDGTDNDGNQTVATWMREPIDSDASWAPLTPPPTRQGSERKKRTARTAPARSKSAVLDPPPGSLTSSSRRVKSSQKVKPKPKAIITTNGPNPVSSDSSSSSEARPRQRSHSQRQRNTARGSSEGSRKMSKTRSENLSAAVSSAQIDATSLASRRGRSRTRIQPTPAESSSALSHPSSPSMMQPPAPLVSGNVRGTSRTRASSRSVTGGNSTTKRERSASVSRRENIMAVTGTVPSSSDVAAKSTKASIRSRSGSRSRPPVTRSRSTSRTPITRSRSVSRTRSSKPPPNTARTRREMRTSSNMSSTSSSNSVGGPMTGISAKRRPSLSGRSTTSIDRDGHSTRSAHLDGSMGRDNSSGRSQALSSNRSTTPKRSAIFEKLFGDQVTQEAKQSYLPRPEPSPTNGSVSSIISWQQPERIHSRILLTATVYHNTATNLWIATINTNQKGVAKNPTTASKYLKAFSFTSEKEARESAIANAPPKMMNFTENPCCFICQGKFAMFRRAGHCRNCGVCVCSSCSTTWPSKMIPETYNLKRESQVKICKTCNFLSGAFKKALLSGDYDEAIALYGSGNINLRTPFPQLSKKKEEVMYPIHCAVEGGCMDIVRWLMEDHFCPIKVIRTGSGKRAKKGGSPDFPILTSKNRSVLTIAVDNLHVDILRYLVVDNNVSVYEAKDLQASLRALEAVLLALPQNVGSRKRGGDDVVHQWDDAIFDGEMSVASSLGADQTVLDEDATTRSKGSKRHGSDSCIICYQNPINCVITPCGHQICCLECSKNLSACPVCNNRGEFIKIFRP